MKKKQVKMCLKLSALVFLNSILMNFSYSEVSSARESLQRTIASTDCQNKLVGNFKIIPGQLFDSFGTIINVDYKSYFKNQKNIFTLTDIYSSKVLRINDELKAYPVTRNSDFTKIVFRGFDEDQKYIFVLDEYGKIIEKIEFSNLSLKEKFESYEFKISDDGRFITAYQSDQISVYDSLIKRWFDLFKTGNGIHKKLASFFVVGEQRFVAFDRDLIIFVETESEKTQQQKAVLNVFSMKSQKLVLQKEISLSHLFLLNREGLVYIDDDQLKYFDLETKVTRNFKIDIKYPISEILFQSGIDHSTLFIDKKIGKIQLYGKDTSLLKNLELNSSIENLISFSNEHLLLDIKGSRNPILLNLRTFQEINLPNLFSGLFNVKQNKNRFFSDQKYLYINALDIGDLNATIGIELKSRCIDNVFSQFELKNISNPFLNLWSQNGGSLLTLLALENEFSGVDKKNLYEDIKNSGLNSLSAYVMMNLAWYANIANETNSNQWLLYLGLFGQSVKNLKFAEKESIVESMSASRAEILKDSPRYKGISTSKLANAIEETIKPYFGISTKGRVDFTLVENDSKVRALILATQAIDGDESTNTGLGFYMKEIESFDLDVNEEKKFNHQWFQGSQNWQVTGKVQRVNLNHLVNKSESIKYADLWADHKLTGIVLISSNFHNGFENLVRRFLSYFESEGFNFGRQSLHMPRDLNFNKDYFRQIYFMPKYEKIENAKSWVQNQIESGHLDYMVKEAHSGGNDEVIWLAKKNILIKGIRNLPDGQSEEINILFPEILDPVYSGKEVPIHDSDFTSWFKNRNINRGTQMLYINASCWSASRALQEIIASNSNLLVELPTIASSWTFENNSENHERMLIDGLRKRKTYAEIAQDLDAIQSSRNPYIFPNQGRYDTEIWDKLKSAMSYQFLLEKR